MGLRDFFKKKPSQQFSVSVVRPLPLVAGSAWIVQVEHWALRFVSFLISLGSAFAIQQVESLLGNVGWLEMAAGWMFAFSAGVLGYFLSRALAYRLMQREAIWLYLPLCLLVEFVEVVCNYIVAVRAIHGADWVKDLPLDQRGPIVLLLYGVLSVIPLFTIFLAVVDMDLERKKGQVSDGSHHLLGQSFGVPVSPKLGQGAGGAGQQQRQAPSAPGQQRPPVAPARQQQQAPPVLGQQRPPVVPARQQQQAPSAPKQSNGVHPSEDVTQTW